MALYSLSYDLRKSKDYQRLYDELAKFGAVRILESVWCFMRVNTSPAGLRQHFAQFVDEDDGLFVCEITNWATRKTSASPPQG